MPAAGGGNGVEGWLGRVLLCAMDKGLWGVGGDCGGVVGVCVLLTGQRGRCVKICPSPAIRKHPAGHRLSVRCMLLS